MVHKRDSIKFKVSTAEKRIKDLDVKKDAYFVSIYDPTDKGWKIHWNNLVNGPFQNCVYCIISSIIRMDSRMEKLLHRMVDDAQEEIYGKDIAEKSDTIH